jgi:integrative and conjugative element protein (TIGR02256 family)
MHKSLNSRTYSIPNSEQQIILTASALEVLSEYRQEGAEPEAGGLLFATFDFPRIFIVEASPPRATDKRWRALFIPDRLRQRQLIKLNFKKGYHFVGEWHTHPEPQPSPSGLDLQSMADSFLKSKHELNYFVMIIVGNGWGNLKLWVSIHDGSASHRLREITLEGDSRRLPNKEH